MCPADHPGSHAPRLSEISLGTGSSHDEGSSHEDFDLDEIARNDAGSRVMAAIRVDDSTAFVSALRELLPFMKE